MIVRPQDVIVKESLPEALAGLLGMHKSGFLFQDFYELHEIASGVQTFQEQMNVIWHYTIGMDSEKENK